MPTATDTRKEENMYATPKKKLIRCVSEFENARLFNPFQKRNWPNQQQSPGLLR